PDDGSTVPDPPRAARRPVFDSRPSAAVLAESPLVHRPQPEPVFPPPPPVPARPLRKGGTDPGDRERREAEKRVQRPAEPAVERAAFGARLLAGVIDAGLVGAGLALVLAPVFYYWWTREIPRAASEVPLLPIVLSSALVVLALVLGFAYFAWF